MKEITEIKLDYLQQTPEMVSLGQHILREDIPSSLSPFIWHPQYRVRYPQQIVEALAILYSQYNSAFDKLVTSNQEWETDYQFARDNSGKPINSFVQIDMNGLPHRFLHQAEYLSPDELVKILRSNIFEYENSLAMYGLLQEIFSTPTQVSSFKYQFRESLDRLRQKHHRPIALLAVTEQKYQAMKTSEFGVPEDEVLPVATVRDISGFDIFFGPNEFLDYLASNNGECDYLIYARTSEPVAKLRNPSLAVETPLLENTDVRRIIKANAITFNIDNPEWGSNNTQRINDTKAWMEPVGMAHHIDHMSELYSKVFRRHLEDNGIDLDAIEEGTVSLSQKNLLGELFMKHPADTLLARPFVEHLLSRSVNPFLIASGQTEIRFKPEVASYGAYGHQRGPINRLKTFNSVAAEIRQRGPYVVQPEMVIPVLVDESDESQYIYIDRNFMSTVDGDTFRFLGGFRSLMPADSIEAKRGRVHGNGSTRWSEIF